MFVPTMILGSFGGLFGALFNTICLRATDFRSKFIKPKQTLFLLEPLAVAVVYCSAVIFIPTFFSCQRADCDGSTSGPG